MTLKFALNFLAAHGQVCIERPTHAQISAAFDRAVENEDQRKVAMDARKVIYESGHVFFNLVDN